MTFEILLKLLQFELDYKMWKLCEYLSDIWYCKNHFHCLSFVQKCENYRWQLNWTMNNFHHNNSDKINYRPTSFSLLSRRNPVSLLLVSGRLGPLLLAKLIYGCGCLLKYIHFLNIATDHPFILLTRKMLLEFRSTESLLQWLHPRHV